MTFDQDVLAVLAEDLGPAARSFLDRTSRRYLKKEPSALQRSDVDDLAKWIAVGLQAALGAQVAEKVKKNLLALK